MNHQTTLAAHCGRAAGIAWRHTAQTLRLIDWREVCAIVWHGLVVLAVLTWHAGFETGAAVHRANDRMAALWRHLWVPAVESTAEAAAAPPRVACATPTVHPLAVVAAELAELTNRELRAVAGIAARRSKHQLIGVICAT
jgi:hypothetical protein